MPITATIMEDRKRGYFTQLRRTASGWEGRRCFLLTTASMTAFRQAVGVTIPDVGDPWDLAGGVLDPTVSGVDFEILGGRDSGIDGGDHGWGVAVVSYTSPTSESGGFTQPVGAKWSEFSITTQQVPVVQAPGGEAIPSEAGISAEANAAEVTVYAVRDSIESYASFIQVLGKANNAAVTIPNLEGFIGSAGSSLTFGPGTLLARGVKPEKLSPTRSRMAYTFGIYPNGCLAEYRRRNADGEFIGDIIRVDVQGRAAFPTHLWW